MKSAQIRRENGGKAKGANGAVKKESEMQIINHSINPGFGKSCYLAVLTNGGMGKGDYAAYGCAVPVGSADLVGDALRKWTIIVAHRGCKLNFEQASQHFLVEEEDYRD